MSPAMMAETAFFGAHESSFKSTWRENKLGLVFSSTDLRTRRDGVTHDIERKEYVSYIGSVEQFKEYLLECAVRNGYGRYEQTIIVSDGAAWIRAMGEELFPESGIWGATVRDFILAA
jgi:hypothetical protein